MPMKKRLFFEEENVRVGQGQPLKQGVGLEAPTPRVDDRRHSRIGGADQKSALLHGPENRLMQMLTRCG